MTRSNRPFREAALIAVTAVWGSTFPLGKELLRRSGPLHYLAARFALATALAAVAFGVHRALRFASVQVPVRSRAHPTILSTARPHRRTPAASVWPGGLALAALLSGAYVLQTIGLSRTTAARSGFLTGLLIPLVPVFDRLLFGARIRPAQVAAVALAVMGSALLMSPHGAARSGPGDWLTIGCAAVFALHIVWSGRFARQLPAGPLTLAQLAGSAALLALAAGGSDLLRSAHVHALPRFVAAEAAGLDLSPLTAWQLLYLAGLGTVAAFGIQTWAQQETPAARVAVIFSLEPLFAAAFAWVWLGERMAPLGLAGGALLVLAVALPSLVGG